MDPKQQLNQLDPKLKEAYERVMGTPVGSTPPQQTPPPATPQAIPNPTMQQPTMSMPQPPIPQGTPMATPNHPMPQAQPMPQMPYHQPSSPTPASPMGMTGNPQIPPTPVNPFGAPTPQQTAPNAKPAAAPGSHGFVAGKRGLKISPIILIIGGLIFLVVYTVFWLKFFNIPLPFLGQ